MGHRVPAESAEGLRVQDEAAARERVADPVGPRDARLESLAPILRAVVDDRAGAAALLRVVHGDVGLDQQLLGGEALFAVEGGDTDAGGDAAGARADLCQVDPREGREQIGGDRLCLALARARQDHRELVSPEPRQGVCLAQTGAQRVRREGDQAVTGGVAERVVDVLEAVDVDREHGRLRASRSASATARRSSSSKRRRLKRPVSSSWSARWPTGPRSASAR